MTRFVLLALLALGTSVAQTRAAAPGTEEKASASLRSMFGDSVAVRRTSLVLSRADQDRIAGACQSRWSRDTIALYTATRGDRLVGYGFLDDVKGKMQSITMLTGFLPDGAIRDVDILVYRESYGGEVANDSFRRQFRGLTPESDIRAGATIKNISGATISARAVTAGVRRASATFRLLKERLPR